MPFAANPLSEAVIPIMDLVPVIPVIRIDDPATAVPLAKALVAGGLRVLEVTLRTEHGLGAIKAMAEAVPDAVVGAGTVLDAAQLRSLRGIGCRFAVSPGSTAELLDAAPEIGIPLLPAATTPTEILTLLTRGYVRQKFFPAEPSGGVPMLKSIFDPIPQVTFCPTGGVNRTNACAYLALKNVACVGGSWVVPRDAIEAGEWGRITTLAREAAGLPR